MSETNNGESLGKQKITLIVRADGRGVIALDRIAAKGQENAAQLMRRFLGDVADTVDFLNTPGITISALQDRFARLILARCPEAPTETLRIIGQIWERAAEIKAQEGRN